MPRQHPLIWILLLALTSGCHEPSWESPPPAQSSSDASVAEELDFVQQTKAVREQRSDSIRISARVVSDEEFSSLTGLSGLHHLILNQGRISDASLVVCKSLTALEHLRLRKSLVSDEGIAHLAAHPTLKILNLPQADLTDQSLQLLSQLPRLEYLRLASPQVTDKGLDHLTRLSTLRFLHLIDVNITDRGLQHVAHMKQLESFYLDGSQATDEGLTQLIKARPDLHFHLNQRHLDHDPQKHQHSTESD